MADERRGYISKAWGLLTKDKGWIKPLLVLGAANLVPIVGGLGVEGYGLEWARLTAWGVDAAPKQKGVRVGECIKSGWRAFIAVLGYMAALAIITAAIRNGLGDGGWAGLLIWIADVLGGGIMAVAALRATIYQRAATGYRLDRIWQMIRRDGNGFLRVILATLAVAAIAGLIELVVGALCIAPAISSAAMMLFGSAYGFGGLDHVALSQLAASLAGIVPALLVFIYFASIMFCWCDLMGATMWGFWMRQFDVARWGASDDPLPDQGQEPPSDCPQLPAARL